MLLRNSGMHMQNYMMSHGQLSIVPTRRDGRSWGSNPGRNNIFLSSTSRPVVGPTDPPVEWCPSSFPWVMRPEREFDASIERRC